MSLWLEAQDVLLLIKVDARSIQRFQSGKMHHFHIIFYQSFFFQQDQIIPSAYSSSECHQTLLFYRVIRIWKLTSIHWHSATIFIHQKAYSRYILAVLPTIVLHWLTIHVHGVLYVCVRIVQISLPRHMIKLPSLRPSCNTTRTLNVTLYSESSIILSLSFIVWHCKAKNSRWQVVLSFETF